MTIEMPIDEWNGQRNLTITSFGRIYKSNGATNGTRGSLTANYTHKAFLEFLENAQKHRIHNYDAATSFMVRFNDSGIQTMIYL